jgi:hypothetical protein
VTLCWFLSEPLKLVPRCAGLLECSWLVVNVFDPPAWCEATTAALGGDEETPPSWEAL